MDYCRYHWNHLACVLSNSAPIHFSKCVFYNHWNHSACKLRYNRSQKKTLRLKLAVPVYVQLNMLDPRLNMSVHC